MATSSDNELSCSLKQCQFKNVINSQTEEHVEVKTFQLSNTELTSQSDKEFFISWSKAGEAIFHFSCWEKALKASRCRNKKISPLPSMTEMEKRMVKEAAKTVEMFSSLEVIQRKAEVIANLLKKSKHCVIFTGAGISTSAGIGDYRGKDGKWTNEDRLIIEEETSAPPPKKPRYESDNSAEEEEEVDYDQLMPTYTHEALKKLMEIGYIKFVISQNCDGLHRLSGVAMEALSELHGNVFVETCERCHKRYERPYYVMDDVASQYFEELSTVGTSDLVKPPHAKMCKRCELTHRTGRKCEEPKCKGHLLDTIINFFDHLNEDVLGRATDQSRSSDLMICLGTSLTVTPANDLVEMTQPPQRIIICNRQTTHLDAASEKLGPDGLPLGCRVWGDCDVLMKEVMKTLLPSKDLRTWEQGRIERQTTHLDAASEKLGPHGLPLGCRVWGDCDVLMKEVVKTLLPSKDLRTWEQGRIERLNIYAKQRNAPYSK